MIDFIGILGAFIILFAFYKLEKGDFSKDSFVYDGLNLIGSSLLLVSAIYLQSYAFILLNSAWALIAINGLVKSSNIR